MIKPKRLYKGDKVAIVSLSRGMIGEKMFIHKYELAKKRLEEFKRFFEPKLDNPGLAREIKMDTEVIQSRINLIETQKAGLNTAIEKEIGRLR